MDLAFPSEFSCQFGQWRKVPQWWLPRRSELIRSFATNHEWQRATFLLPLFDRNVDTYGVPCTCKWEHLEDRLVITWSPRSFVECHPLTQVIEHKVTPFDSRYRWGRCKALKNDWRHALLTHLACCLRRNIDRRWACHKGLKDFQHTLSSAFSSMISFFQKKHEMKFLMFNFSRLREITLPIELESKIIVLYSSRSSSAEESSTKGFERGFLSLTGMFWRFSRAIFDGSPFWG